MGYRKVYRTVDEQTTKKMVKMLQRHGIMAYGKSEGAGEILQNWNTVSGTRCLCEGRTGRGGKKTDCRLGEKRGIS